MINNREVAVGLVDIKEKFERSAAFCRNLTKDGQISKPDITMWNLCGDKKASEDRKDFSPENKTIVISMITVTKPKFKLLTLP